jgi:hypothetical protein
MKLAIEANKVYRPLWQTKKRYVILMGGRGAGRSFETSLKDCCQSSANHPPLPRGDHADIRRSIWQESLTALARGTLTRLCVSLTASWKWSMGTTAFMPTALRNHHLTGRQS